MGLFEAGNNEHYNLARISSLFSSRTDRQQRTRSRFLSFFMFKRFGYLQWMCTTAVFFFLLMLFQAFLPSSVMEGSIKSRKELVLSSDDLVYLNQIRWLDFGEDLKFEPKKLVGKVKENELGVNVSDQSKRGVRFAYRKPQLAMVFADLKVDQYQILMATVASALLEIGYQIQVFSSVGGPARTVWHEMGVPVAFIPTKYKMEEAVDWLNYDGILVNSLETEGIFANLMQEPFKSIPLVWTIHEKSLASHIYPYTWTGISEMLDPWQKKFNRATLVVFPNHVLPMSYSTFDDGNFFVIPGTLPEACVVEHTAPDHEQLPIKRDISPHDFVIAVVSSPFMYGGMWLDHALVLKALIPFKGSVEVFVLTRDLPIQYSLVLEELSTSLGYPRGGLKHVASDDDRADNVLRTANLVIYGSYKEDQSFPEILTKAMCLGKLVVAPNHSIIKKYVTDRVNGYLFPIEDIEVLTEIMSHVVLRGKLSPKARKVASIGKETAKNMMVLETVEGYASLLENMLTLPSEVAPKRVADIPPKDKKEWKWNVLKMTPEATYTNRTSSSYAFFKELEELRYHTESEAMTPEEESDLYSIWEDQKETAMAYARKKRDEHEVKARSRQPRGTWDKAHQIAKRADRLRFSLKEKEDGELERTGQPLCIYEPYLGQGAWPFLHRHSIYRGIGLAKKDRRPGTDDVDASSRLPVLVNPHYRNVLGEFGAFLAIANQVDHIHKNAWIGFHSWRATARKAALSDIAEEALLNAVEKQRHGDALYFWAPMDTDPRNPFRLRFWSFCDAVNAGNCRSAFHEVMRRMYGVGHGVNNLPYMPLKGGTWSVSQCWALPTRSFLEFVMFARIFVDAMDAQMYDEHHKNGQCYFSLSEDKHCYSRMLELLVNVWAYHSARRMVYVDPETGEMQEQHLLNSRRGLMWVNWFSYTTLKAMDQDLAEEADDDPRSGRWLWPETGEIFWQGMYEKARKQRQKERERRKQRTKERIKRIKERTQQKPLGKYVMPPPEDHNSTAR